MFDDDQDANLGTEESLEASEPMSEDTPQAETETHDDIVDRALRNLSNLDDADAEVAMPVSEDNEPMAGSVDDEVPADVPDEVDMTDVRVEDVPTDMADTTDTADTSDSADYEELPEDDGDGEARESDPLAVASEAARGAGQQIKDGIAAFKSVREASQRHLSARDTLNAMREQLDKDTAQLKYRLDIEQRYPQIVSEQTAELEQATALAKESLERANALDAERADLESQLSIMKDRHEDQLRPYRNVAESTKGRADDAARALAEAKRATKNAEANLTEATKRRDQRISTANRAVDSAQDRMRKLQSELESAQADSETAPSAIARLQNELVSVKAHLDSAVADVPVITEDARQSVESAQSKLFEQKKLQTQAERDAETAKKEASARRSEYEGLFKRAQEEERALSEQIKLRVTASEKARKEYSDATARINNAKALLDEAETVHSNPQETIALRDQITHEQADFDHQQDAVDELAANEKALRRGTFKQRLILVLGCVAVLAIVLAIVFLVVMGGNKKQSTPAPKQETQQTQVKESDKDEKDGKDESKKEESGTTSTTTGTDADKNTEATSTKDDASKTDSATSGTSSSSSTSSSATKDDATSSTDKTSTSTNGTTSSTSTTNKNSNERAWHRAPRHPCAIETQGP